MWRRAGRSWRGWGRRRSAAKLGRRGRGRASRGRGGWCCSVGLGIDLGNDGVTANDPLDADAGPNNRQNFPELTTVVSTSTTTTVKGTLKSTPSATFFIDVYASPTPHASGYGQGQQYLGGFGATTDASGFVNFAQSFSINIPAGWVITATAQNAALETSEFSAAFIVPDNIPPQITGGNFDVTQGPEHRVLVKFTENVLASLQNTDFKLRNLTTNVDYDVTGFTWDPSTLAATLFAGRTLPDGNYRLTALASGISDPAGNQLDGNADGTGGDNFTFDFYVLGGDANRDRRVDFNDLVFLAQNYNTADPSLNWFTADFNYDHRVDFEDLVIMAQHYNTSLPAPAIPLATRAAPTPHASVQPTRFSTKKLVLDVPAKPVTKPVSPNRIAPIKHAGKRAP